MDAKVKLSERMRNITKPIPLRVGEIDCLVLKHTQSTNISFGPNDVFRTSIPANSKVAALVKIYEDFYKISGVKLADDNFTLSPQKIIGEMADQSVLYVCAVASPNPIAPILSQQQQQPKDDNSGVVNPHETIDDHTAAGNTDEIPKPAPFEVLTLRQIRIGTSKGLVYLRQLREVLVKNSPESFWLDEVDKAAQSYKDARSIIGIFGATGAGKSSIVNALLGEEQLIPTNCMRASTATVTEIMYNKTGLSEYVAEIEFVGIEEWRLELEILLGDIQDGGNRPATDSEAEVAHSKVRAVYPEIKKQELYTLDVETLVQHQNVRGILGTTKRILAHDAAELSRRLQIYVDSKEKVDMSQSDLTQKSNAEPSMEFWPLIRVVKLHVKAPALVNGSILVDLPGVHDSNAARAAVARNYMQRCSSIWVVAPIVRAIDDKSARTLLNDSFKRQLAMDGNFGIITIVCSKTDEIKIGEATNSLQLAETFKGVDERLQQITDEKAVIKQQSVVIKKDFDDCREQKGTLQSQFKWYEQKKRLVAEGILVHPPLFENAKRKRTAEVISPSKRQRQVDNQLDRAEVEERDDELDIAQDLSAAPLTVASIGSTLAGLKASKSFVAESMSKKKRELESLRQKIRVLDAEESTIKDRKWRVCVSERNRYVRQAMQEQFADSIRDLDHEIAAEADPDNFDPTIDTRDYETISKGLPVFCVSSAGYHDLSGRLVHERISHSFENTTVTEIPLLGNHCLAIGEAAQRKSHERFLEDLNQLLTQLRLWTSKDDSMSATKNDAGEAKKVEEQLTEMIKQMSARGTTIMVDLSSFVDNKIFTVSPRAVRKAQNQALDTCTRWGAPASEGGIRWNTYRAILRRDGVFNGRNFNDDLLRPLQDSMMPAWKQVFAHALPSMFAKAKEACQVSLQEFHKGLSDWCVKKGTPPAKLRELDNLTISFQATMRRTFEDVEKHVTAGAREANRVFIEAIEEQMHDIWRVGATERGPGMFSRSKNIVKEGLEENRGRMFADSVDRVKEILLDILNRNDQILQDTLADQAKMMRKGFKHFISRRKHALDQNDLKRLEIVRASIREGDSMMEKLFDEEPPATPDNIENVSTPGVKREQSTPQGVLTPFRSMSVTHETADHAIEDDLLSESSAGSCFDDENDLDYEDE